MGVDWKNYNETSLEELDELQGKWPVSSESIRFSRLITNSTKIATHRSGEHLRVSKGSSFEEQKLFLEDNFRHPHRATL